MSPSQQVLIDEYQRLRDNANRVALALEETGLVGYYVKPDGNNGRLDPTTRPTQFEWKAR